MKVFLSWSGTRSKQVATILRDWLPNVIQAVDPWMSSEDIDKGARWSSEIAKELEATKAGIICVTPENQDASWLNFEAGALSKVVDKTMVCPYLFQMKPSELKGPLVQFQATETSREDSRKLLLTLNTGLGAKALSEANLSRAFEKWWADLEAKLEEIPKTLKPVITHRSSEDMIEEVLSLTREQARTTEEVRAAIYQMQLDRKFAEIVARPSGNFENLVAIRDSAPSSLYGGPTIRSVRWADYSPGTGTLAHYEEPEIDPAGETTMFRPESGKD